MWINAHHASDPICCNDAQTMWSRLFGSFDQGVERAFADEMDVAARKRLRVRPVRVHYASKQEA